MSTPENYVLAFSTGIDATCLWYVLDRPDALYVGGPNGPARDASPGEFAALQTMRQWMGDRLIFKEVDFRPFRRAGRWKNARSVIIGIVAEAMGYAGMYVGWVSDDRCSRAGIDRRREELAQAVGFGFQVMMPCWQFDKRTLVQMALAKGAPPEHLAASYSCWQSTPACGKCKSCLQRIDALKVNGIKP